MSTDENPERVFPELGGRIDFLFESTVLQVTGTV